ncbi:MAG: heparinase II/III-family protein [Chthoniobacterales bacterium]
MNLRWYIARLGGMNPQEIGHRIFERLRRAMSRRGRGWGRFPAPSLRLVFPDWQSRVRRADPREQAALRAAAMKILAGEFDALGVHWPSRMPSNLFPSTVWSLDPVSGTRWPADAYCFDIDFRQELSRRDIKYVWEFNRLQALPVLAAFSLHTDDPTALTVIETAIGSWHAANLPFLGVGWSSGIEVALRAISLLATLSLAGDRLSEEATRKVAEILTASAFWLHRFPSLHSSANNHRVAELAGEVLIALALAADTQASKADLERQFLRQILPDGAPAEQSPTYGAFTAELMLLAASAARGAGTPFSSEVEERLVAFADFASWIGPMRFGDDDEGRVLALSDGEDYVASVAAALGGRGSSPARIVSLLCLVIGNPKSDRGPHLGLRTFPQGGLSIWRGQLGGRKIELLFDHGPLGYLSIAAHGHADCLAVSLAIDDRPVLVDPGTYLYGSGSLWREWFRSTPAHNTLNIGGESQSLSVGPFNWSQKARAALTDVGDGPLWSLSARHDGYRRRFGVDHERQLELAAEEILITDRLIGHAQPAELVFQLAPGMSTSRNGNCLTVFDGREALLEIELARGAIAVSNGVENAPETGWVSLRFGSKQAGVRITWKGGIGNEPVVTRLRPVAPNAG